MGQKPDIPPAGLLMRNSRDIARVLESLHKLAQPITTALGGDNLLFSSLLLYVDPERHYIVVAAAATDDVNAALLARPRLNFISEFAGWHVEFAAPDPQSTTIAGKRAFRLGFPDVLITQQRRQEPRAAVPPGPPLHCVADSHGITPFEAQIVDISGGGVGFLLYAVDITLEPGTVLKGCHIERPGAAPMLVDLEVRYSRPVVLADGSHARRSGCVFLNPTKEVTELIESYLGGSPPAPGPERAE